MVTTVSALPTPPSRGSSASTFSADADAFMDALPTFRTELNQLATDLVAFTSGLDFNGTSSSSVAIGTGTKTFTVPAGKLWFGGQPIIVVDAVTPTNYMTGIVSTYSGTTLVVAVASSSGSGTKTSWVIGPIPPGSVPWTSLSGTLTLAQLNAAVSDADLVPMGLTQIAQLTASSGTTQTFSSIPQTYAELLVVFSAITQNSGASRNLAWAVSPDGSTFSTATNQTYMGSDGTTPMVGAMSIPGYSKAAGVAIGGSGAAANSTAGLSGALGWTVSSGGIVALRFSWASGAAFTGGTITLFGR